MHFIVIKCRYYHYSLCIDTYEHYVFVTVIVHPFLHTVSCLVCPSMSSNFKIDDNKEQEEKYDYNLKISTKVTMFHQSDLATKMSAVAFVS